MSLTPGDALTKPACPLTVQPCRYVTPGAFVESALFAGIPEDQLNDWELLARVRFAVYKPGGPMAVELSKNPTVLVVNDTAFAHGGLLPVHGECDAAETSARLSQLAL